MSQPALLHVQRGATLIVGLIMLTLITLMVITALRLSSSNLKSVGNMQFRNEAIAAANNAIGQVISDWTVTSSNANVPGAKVINVCLNNSGTGTGCTRNYVVSIAALTCIRAVLDNTLPKCDVEHKDMCTTGDSWNTTWDIDATVTDTASGTSVHVHEGVRVLLPQSLKNSVCN